MEVINTIELRDPGVYPDEDVLKKVLGDGFDLYLQLLDLFKQNNMEYDWRYYRDGKAWLCKVQHKKRTIVWMSAWKGYIQATIYFPGKYINDLYELDISNEVIDILKSTKDVGKSKPCSKILTV